MPEKDEVTLCAICGRGPVGDTYPRAICPRCDAMAVNDAARPAACEADGSSGDNPVFIDSRQCWRLYAPGGYVTLLDEDNCRDLYDFCKRNGLVYAE